MSNTLPKHQEIADVINSLATSHLQGKIRAIKLAMTALLADGHILLEDLPGLGKTTLALALAHSLGLSFGRIQCTSDLLPSDITGLSIFNRRDNNFEFLPGPIFNHFVLVDEINRAMPKTQSALLEAMEEKKVTVEGKTYPLPEPFLVIATQNPVDQIGTFPLPESQLDRFLLATGIGYPPPEIEKAIIRAGSIRQQLVGMPTQLSKEDILDTRHIIKERVVVSEPVIDYIHELLAATRNHRFIQTGISTRGGINLAEAAKVVAFLHNRPFVIPEDIQEIIVPLGAHRLILKGEHLGTNKEELLRSIIANVPVPRS